jgi:hypothetical protein
LCVAPQHRDDVVARAGAAGVEVAEIGRVGGHRLVVRGLVDLSLADAADAWTGALPGKLQLLDG